MRYRAILEFGHDKNINNPVKEVLKVIKKKQRLP